MPRSASSFLCDTTVLAIWTTNFSTCQVRLLEHEQVPQQHVLDEVAVCTPHAGHPWPAKGRKDATEGSSKGEPKDRHPDRHEDAGG
jgi:hypothetical protein